MSATPGREPARKPFAVVVLSALLSTLALSGLAWADLRAPVPPIVADLPAQPAAVAVTTTAALAAAAVPAPASAPAVPEAVTELVDGHLCTTVGGLPVCTHEHGPMHTAGTGSSASAPQVPVGCAGDGVGGNRIQVVYVRQSDRPDRFGAVLGAVRREVDVANGVFTRSSDGHRALRVVTDGACAVAVDRLTVSPAQASSFAELTKAVRAAGRSRADRKYLLYVDNDRGCGIAEQFLDERPTSDNRNNDGNAIAAVHAPCWDGVLVAHELTHVLGGVQNGAPRSTGRGHCTDRNDVMCYPDGSGKAMTARCPAWHASLLDCGRDDYFSLAPAPGSYLAGAWNTASSSFLVGGGPAVPTAPSPPTAVGSARHGDVVRVTWGTPEQARSGVAGFDVVDLAASGEVVASVGGAARAAEVTLTPWRTYRLAVVAHNAAGRSAPAGGHEHLVGRPPSAPLAVTALPRSEGVEVHVSVTWTAPGGATSYVVLRDGQPVGTTTGTQWVDTAPLDLGRVYTYAVQALSAWGASPPSAGAPTVGVQGIRLAA